jgi:opacity protein-like surface antigen
MVSAQDYIRPGSVTHDYYTGPESGAPKQGNKKFSLGVSFGVAVPMQDFGSTNVNNSFWDFNSPDSVRLQGFAKPGFHFNITASYLITDNIGIMLMIGGSSNSFDVNTFSATIGYPVYVSSNSYYTSEYLIGPFVSLPLSQKFTAKISAMIGIASSSYPSIDIALNDTLTAELDFNGGNGFAYNIGAGIEYNVNSNLSILLNLSYTGVTINYPSWMETYSSPGYYPLQITHSNDETQMSIGLLKPTLGIDYKF